jgi:hypothetical protein
VDWHHDGQSLFTCGGDNMAMRCELRKNSPSFAAQYQTERPIHRAAHHTPAGTLANGAIQPTPVAKHDAPIKTCSWWSDVNLLV